MFMGRLVEAISATDLKQNLMPHAAYDATANALPDCLKRQYIKIQMPHAACDATAHALSNCPRRQLTEIIMWHIMRELMRCPTAQSGNISKLNASCVK